MAGWNWEKAVAKERPIATKAAREAVREVFGVPKYFSVQLASVELSPGFENVYKFRVYSTRQAFDPFDLEILIDKSGKIYVGRHRTAYAGKRKR
jgi:hypothetical protein